MDKINGNRYLPIGSNTESKLISPFNLITKTLRQSIVPSRVRMTKKIKVIYNKYNRKSKMGNLELIKVVMSEKINRKYLELQKRTQI